MPMLRPHLPWTEEKAERDALNLDPLHLRPQHIVYADLPARRLKQNLNHDTRLLDVQQALIAAGFSVGTQWLDGVRPDLVAVRKKEVVVVEGKVIERGRGRNESRAALGQILEYTWELKRAAGQSGFEFRQWIAFSTRPAPKIAEFLHDHGMIVSWVNGGALSFFVKPKFLGTR